MEYIFLVFFTLIFPPVLSYLKLLSFLSIVFSDGNLLVFISRKIKLCRMHHLGFMHVLLGYFTCESLSNFYTRFCAISKKTGKFLKRQDEKELI